MSGRPQSRPHFFRDGRLTEAAAVSFLAMEKGALGRQ